MKKICLKFSILLFSYAGLSQTYTITQKPSYIPNTSTYTVRQEGTGAYANPQTYTPTTTSAQHIQNMQNNISSSMNTVSSSMGSVLVFVLFVYAGFETIGLGFNVSTVPFL